MQVPRSYRSRYPGIFLALTILLALASAGQLQAQIHVAVEVNPDPVVPGGVLEVRLTASNSGSTASGAIRLEMGYPEGLDRLLDTGISDGGDCTDQTDGIRCNSGEDVFWDLGPIGGGEARTVTLPPVVAADAAGTMLPFEAQVFEDGVLRDSSMQTVEVVTEAPLSLSVQPDQEPVVMDQLLTYSLIAGNQSVSSVQNTQLRLPIPSGSAFVSASSGATESVGIVSWNIGTLFSGQSSRFSVTVRVDDDSPMGTLLLLDSATLSAELNFAEVQGRARAVTHVGRAPALLFALEARSDPLLPQEPLQTRLTVTNTSGSVMSGVTVEFRYPEHMERLLDTGLSDGGDCTDLADGIRCNPRELAIWSLGTLGPGAGRTVFLEPLLLDGIPDGTLIRLQGKAFADGVREVWERRAVAVNANRLLNLSVDPSQEPAEAGSLLTYRFVLANRGTVASRDTQLSFPLPSGVSFVSATGGGTESSGEVVWDIGLLPAGQGIRSQVLVQVAGDLPSGTILESDSAMATSTADLVPQESRTVLAARIGAPPLLSLALESNFDPIQPEEHLEMRLTVANRTNAPVTGVTVELQYAFNLERLLDTGLSDGGDCTNLSDGIRCNEQEVVVWNLGTLGPGSGRTVSLPPRLDRGTSSGTLIFQRARAFSDFAPSVWERKTLLVAENRQLNLRVDVDRDPAGPGELLTYGLWFSNRGDIQVRETQLQFPLPEGVDILAVNGYPQFEEDSLAWDIGMLAAGEGGRFQLTVQVNDTLALGTILRGQPTILTAETDLETHESRVHPAVRSEAGLELDLAMKTGLEAFQPDQSIPAELIVTNASDSILTGVTAMLFFPDFLDRVLDQQISDGGDCTTLADGIRCNSLETVVWDLGNLAPGTTRSVSLPPVINRNTMSGEFIRFFASVSDDASQRAYTSDTALVGTLNGDANGDGIVDVADLVTVLDPILQGTFEPASDCSGDGFSDVQDAGCILDLIKK